MEIPGEVGAAQEWRMPFGQGWSFRVMPIKPISAGYSGWDLVVDWEPLAGYPDALLLATLPYGSINQREVGTTFGLRAQDAIGWNPRTFRFLSIPEDFHAARSLFFQLQSQASQPAASDRADTQTTHRLLELEGHASRGQFQILDARIVPGIGDPQPFAQAWAQAASRTPHEIESVPPGQETATGKLLWMRFKVTLWLPEAWRVPPALRTFPSPVRNKDS